LVLALKKIQAVLSVAEQLLDIHDVDRDPLSALPPHVLWPSPLDPGPLLWGLSVVHPAAMSPEAILLHVHRPQMIPVEHREEALGVL
jgi:hypothetical protein